MGSAGGRGGIVRVAMVGRISRRGLKTTRWLHNIIFEEEAEPLSKCRVAEWWLRIPQLWLYIISPIFPLAVDHCIVFALPKARHLFRMPLANCETLFCHPYIAPRSDQERVPIGSQLKMWRNLQTLAFLDHWYVLGIGVGRNVVC